MAQSLILAHPGSGTHAYWRHTTDENYRGYIAHESLKSTAKVVITYRTWDFSKFTNITHMVRNPFHTVRSFHALLGRRQWKGTIPKRWLGVAESSGCQKLLDDKYDPLLFAMGSVLGFNEKAEKLKIVRFRVEDVIPDKRTNSHVDKVKDKKFPLATWEKLEELDKDMAIALREQMLRYGYTDE